MIAAFLCGLMFGALGYRAWWIKPRELKAEFEAWDQLSDEALGNFEQKLVPTPYDSETEIFGVPETFGILKTFGTPRDWNPVEGLRHTSSGDIQP